MTATGCGAGATNTGGTAGERAAAGPGHAVGPDGGGATDDAATDGPATGGGTNPPASTTAQATTPTAPATTTAVDEAPLPRTAPDLAAALTEVEQALRAPGLDQVTAAPWGRRQQLLYRLLAANPSWADEVLAAVDAEVADVVAINWAARQHLLALVRSEGVHRMLPAWRIEAPAPADELLGHYRAAGDATGVPWEVLAAINLIETRMGRIGGESSAGAVGPMQFLPSTWAECCVGDPTDNGDAIRGAAKYLVDRGAARDLDRAIFGYNNSNHYVGAVRAYAALLADGPSAYYGYHAWQVLYLTDDGLYLLPEGYDEATPVPVGEWRAAHPETRYDLIVNG